MESVYYALKRKQEKNINFQNERQTEQTQKLTSQY